MTTPMAFSPARPTCRGGAFSPAAPQCAGGRVVLKLHRPEAFFSVTRQPRAVTGHSMGGFRHRADRSRSVGAYAGGRQQDGGRTQQGQQQQGRRRRGTTEEGQGRHATRSERTSTAVGAPPPSLAPSPALIGGVFFLGFPALGWLIKKNAQKQLDLELQRKFRGELIRRRLKKAVGRNWQGQTVRFGQGVDDGEMQMAEDELDEDYSGVTKLTARDLALARTRGFVRADKTKAREEDYELLKLATAQNNADAAAAAAITRGVPLGKSARRSSKSTSSAAEVEQNLVFVTLGVTASVREGQGIAVTGGPPALGAWEIKDAVILDRVGADRWQCVTQVAPGSLEYRYALVTTLPDGELQLETELGPPRTRVIVSDASSPQLVIDETPPSFSTADVTSKMEVAAAAAMPGSAPRGNGPDAVNLVDVEAARRVAATHEVDLDTALEIMSLVRNDETLAGKLLGTVSRGITGATTPAKPPVPRPFPVSPAAEAVPVEPNPDVSEYFISDDVKVVEDFSDVSDDELAALINDLQRELAENDTK